MQNSELTAAERKNALMNALTMMLADKKIEPQELDFLRAVARRVGATREDVEDIMKNPSGVRFVVPQNVRERVAQLLDMIVMMSIDGQIDRREKDLCIKFALAMGFNPLRVSMLIDKISEGLKKGKDKNTIREDVTLIID